TGRDSMTVSLGLSDLDGDALSSRALPSAFDLDCFEERTFQFGFSSTDASYSYSCRGTIDTIGTVVSVSANPEPSTLVLCGSAASLGLAGRWWRRRRRRVSA